MPIDVVLNVYDLIDQTPLCCGFFHTGIEVLGAEYSFAGGAGVYECQPRQAPDGRFRQSIILGTVESTAVARAALDRLRPEFHGDAYSLVFRNCNDFSSAYSLALCGRDIPGWINRLARMGRAWPIRLCLPPHLRAGNGTEYNNQAPLLSQRSVQAPLWTGEGHSLGGASVAENSAAGCRGLGRGLLASVSRAFGRRAQERSSDDSGGLVPGGNARELRAAAAARRCGGLMETVDIETARDNGGGGATPMPNPWR